MTRLNFLVGVAVSLVLPLACLLAGLSMTQPAAATGIAIASAQSAHGAADMERVQRRFVEILKARSQR